MHAMHNKAIKAIVSVVALLVASACNAQVCTTGTVLWVTETVNADVGLAMTPAGVNATCAATAAGAVYDDPAQPFGLQAAMDCACAGADIRILAGVNEYDSTTASWNNRRNPTKGIYFTRVGQSLVNQVTRMMGYVDVTTPCYANAQTDCPVQLNFATGTGDGMNHEGAVNPNGQVFIGLGFKNAALRGLETSLGSFAFRIALEASGNGLSGFFITGDEVLNLDLYAHNNGKHGIESRGNSFLMEAHNNTENGQMNNSCCSFVSRALYYDNLLVGYGSEAGANPILDHYVTYNNTSSGYRLATGAVGLTGLNAGVNVNNGRYAAENHTNTPFGSMAIFNCEVASGNVLGAYLPTYPANPYFAALLGTIDSASIITYPAFPDFSASSSVCNAATACSFTFPNSSTAITFVPGANATCGGGLTIQSVRRP